MAAQRQSLLGRKRPREVPLSPRPRLEGRGGLGVQAGPQRERAHSQPVAVFIFARPPDRRKRDLDNILKAILDALVYGGVIKDDYQVEEIHLIRKPPEPGGRVEVYLEVMDP